MRKELQPPIWAPHRSKEEIFRSLIRDAKTYWPELPDSTDRMDPVLRVLYGAFACQLESLYGTIDHICERMFEALARHLYYDALLSPVPAFTTLRFDPTDEGIIVDELTTVIYTEERADEPHTYYFSPVAGLELVLAKPSKLFLLTRGELLDLSYKLSPEESGGGETFPISADDFRRLGGGNLALYLGIQSVSGRRELPGLNLFLDAAKEPLAWLRWAVWTPSTSEGLFPKERSVVPGKEGPRTEFLLSASEGSPLLPHHRGPRDFLADAQDRFFKITDLKTSPPPKELQNLLGENLEDSENTAWIKIVLPEEADEAKVSEIRGIHPNCVPAINRRPMIHNHATQGLSLVEVTLPDPLEKIYRIEEVRDSSGRTYRNRLGASGAPNLYTVREEGERPQIILHFKRGESIPKSIQVAYSVTEGEGANGIEPGQINEIYDRRRHPGIEAVTNTTRSMGGLNPPSREELLSAFTDLLRTRSRAVTSTDIEGLALGFDPRIKKAVCDSGVEKGPSGARRCVRLSVALKKGSFACKEESDLFINRLSTYLKERSPLNTVLRVQLMEE